MKKTLVALGVSAAILASSSALASKTLYSHDGLTLKMAAAMEIQYRLRPSDSVKHEKAEMRVDDGDLEFFLRQMINDDLYAIGDVAFKIGEGDDDSSNPNDIKNDELFVGLGGSFGELTFGRQVLFVDSIGVDEDYEADNGNGFKVANSPQSIKYYYDNDNFYGGFTYLIDANDADKDDLDDKKTGGYEVKIGGVVGDFEVRAFGQLSRYQEASLYKQYELDVFYNMTDALTLGIDGGKYFAGNSFTNMYNYNDLNSDVSYDDYTFFDASAAYELNEKDTIKAGFGYRDFAHNSFDDEDYSHKYNSIATTYANVTHKLASNAKVYAEVLYQDSNSDSSSKNYNQFGFDLGMEVKF